ncbi:MAG: hypothetical protein Q8941_09970 [Bacteroidota bacterium]|nr:hypothetical protein [Bacteroidota bacterium]
MPELKLRQLQYESDAWKRLLGFITDENIHQKNRLSEILKDEFDKNLLDEVENFQTRFVREDNLIYLLRNELAGYDKLLVREAFEDGALSREVNTKLKKLRADIVEAEKEFSKLKSEFNNYLLENI